MVRDGRFVLDKPTSDQLHAIIARDEAFDAGHFRGEGAEQKLTPGVALGEFGRYLPPETQPGGVNLRQPDCHPDATDLMSSALRAALDG